MERASLGACSFFVICYRQGVRAKYLVNFLIIATVICSVFKVVLYRSLFDLCPKNILDPM